MPRGVLLIHGFTATPECLDSLRKPLEEADFLVEAPLLAGHGTSAAELRRTTWRDWYESIIPAYRALEKKTEAVCVAGLSLGGLLAIRLAEEFCVRRLALLAVPIFFKGFIMTQLLPLLAKTPIRHLYPYQFKFLGPSINDPTGRRAFQAYKLMPLASIMEIVRLQDDI